MQKGKMKVLLYLKKSGMDKSGQAPIMGRITYNRTMAQFSSKLSCNPKFWNVRESRLNGKSREAVATNSKLEQLLLSVQSARKSTFATDHETWHQKIVFSREASLCFEYLKTYLLPPLGGKNPVGLIKK